MRVEVSLTILCLMLGQADYTTAADPAGSATRISFEKQIAPLLETHCIRCHSPNNRKGELSLETIVDLKENGYIAPGDPAGSYLIDVVTSQDGQPAEMPKEGDALSIEEIGLLKLWIEQGAKYKFIQ